MAFTDIATRVWDHGWRLDPIVRSLLDTDFYKLLMLQMIRQRHPDVRATFSLINRTTRIRLADDIDIAELRAQLQLGIAFHLRVLFDCLLEITVRLEKLGETVAGFVRQLVVGVLFEQIVQRVSVALFQLRAGLARHHGLERLETQIARFRLEGGLRRGQSSVELLRRRSLRLRGIR